MLPKNNFAAGVDSKTSLIKLRGLSRVKPLATTAETTGISAAPRVIKQEVDESKIAVTLRRLRGRVALNSDAIEIEKTDFTSQTWG